MTYLFRTPYNKPLPATLIPSEWILISTRRAGLTASGSFRQQLDERSTALLIHVLYRKYDVCTYTGLSAGRNEAMLCNKPASFVVLKKSGLWKKLTQIQSKPYILQNAELERLNMELN